MGRNENELLDEVINAIRELQAEDERDEREGAKKREKSKKPTLIKIVFNDPVTIIKWSDGADTAYREESETYDPKKGFEYCVLKKMIGEKNFKTWQQTCKRLQNSTNLNF